MSSVSHPVMENTQTAAAGDEMTKSGKGGTNTHRKLRGNYPRAEE